jgi:sialate O-acetylesterase
MRKPYLLVLFFFGINYCLADVRLPAVLSSNMVLQQQTHVKLWGWSEPGEKIVVTASWDHQTDSARGTRDGKWEVLISTPSAGGPYSIVIKGRNTITLENVLIGEVWVCSGQSNMEMCETWGLPDIRKELPSCDNASIRFFHVPRSTAAYPQEDGRGQWAACDSNELKTFSAVAYFFGKKLHSELNVPIGLIEAAWGGTPAEVWTPASLVSGDSVLMTTAAKQGHADGWPYLPGYCYNGMLAPLTSFAIAGALWYQGESNTVAPLSYARLLTAMIGSWRKAWNKDFPFYYVQIAPFTYDVKDQGAALREQQTLCSNVKNTGMVVISDLVEDTTNIHPKNKHDVGLRLAAWALADTYHKPAIVCRDPAFRSLTQKGDKITLTFSNVSGGLTAHGPEIREFVIAGADRIFYPAHARIEGDRIIVSAAQVKEPVAVRYQFDNAGIGNVFGKEGLPLAPFRTDDWPIPSLQ